jgi:hypothetical protein
MSSVSFGNASSGRSNEYDDIAGNALYPLQAASTCEGVSCNQAEGRTGWVADLM